MHFIPEALDHYAVQHSEDEPKLLQALTRETYQKVLQPRMLSGHYQGRLLSIISKLIRPKTILELGTFTGYSALCLAEGMQKDGELHTIDINEELVNFRGAILISQNMATKFINTWDLLLKLFQN